MAPILDIARVWVGVPDRKAWEAFAHDVLGFATSRSSDGRLSGAATSSPRRS